jgi:aspartokinase-like uncharacterized kinase
MCDVVVKIGGGLLARVADLDGVLAAVTALARTRRVLIIPGGGPFADTVRNVDRRIGIPAEAAHWMAILAMDQYAHLLTSRLANGVVVSTMADALAAADQRRLPVLAPSRWLAAADPLPHSWDVTSDSIAAWVAGATNASALVLVKPAGVIGSPVDGYFARALPSHLTPIVLPAEQAASALAQLAHGSTVAAP